MSSGPQPRGSLDVWLAGELLGSLSDRTFGYVAFDFEEEVISRHGVGSLLLSLALPVSWDTVDPFIATAFFAGLLPEGEARRRLCAEFRVAPEDTYGLLTELGRESAGALIILPPGELLSTAAAELHPLDELQLVAELDRLSLTPLGVTVADDEIRLSLAGVQDKLPLTRTDEGALALPIHGHPSTVIAKPARQEERFPELVQNEAFCLAVATEIGIPTAAFAVLDLNGTPLLLVERYDRVRSENGTIVRLHQEDACQATATHPANKYEAGGGPSLARVAGLLDHSRQPGLDRMSLMRLVVLNTVLGNCDAHGKNFSFLHSPDGVQLAPAYDLVSTAVYQHTDELAMRIGGVVRLRDLQRDVLLAQAADLGVRPLLAERILAELAEHVPVALAAARRRAEAEGWASPIVERIAEASAARATRLLTA